MFVAAGRLDEAATIYLGALDSEDWRGPALLLAQEYPPTLHETQIGRDLASQWQLLLERPQVRAAILRVGRIESFDIVRP